MGHVTRVQTTSGVEDLDLDAADKLVVSVGGVTHTIEKPCIRLALQAYVHGDINYIREQQLLAMNRKMMGL